MPTPKSCVAKMNQLCPDQRDREPIIIDDIDGGIGEEMIIIDDGGGTDVAEYCKLVVAIYGNFAKYCQNMAFELWDGAMNCEALRACLG